MKLPSIRRPSPSLAVSVLALLVAAGGTSYAAVKIQTSDIAQQAVTAGKIRNETIKSNDVRDGSLKSKDFSGGVTGAPGPAGPAGPTGPAGPPGAGAGATRWLLVGRDGTIQAQSGGFSVVAAYPVLPESAPGMGDQLRANGNFYINAGEDVSDNGITASVVLQNTVNVGGDGMGGRDVGADKNLEFSGEIAVSICNVGNPQTPPQGPTNCAPMGARNANSFVVSPRLSDGQVTSGTPSNGTDNTRKPFYVIMTPSSGGVTPPPLPLPIP